MNSSQHGGGVARAALRLGLDAEAILDFSASINPLGMPPAVLEAARGSLEQAVHYPEIDGATLRGALADFHGISSDHLLPGCGSTELIYLLPRVLRPRRALLVTPAFSEYERSLKQGETAVDYFPLRPEDGFRLDPARLLGRLEPDTELVVLANPGNPTGATVEPAALEAIAYGLANRGVLVVDEAFVDFDPQLSVIDRVPSHSNLYVLRSLTKFYAIPGLRAGYLAGPARGVARLAAARQPWSLSSPALAASLAALGEERYRQQTLALIPELRRQLSDGLEFLGLTVFPGAANYLLAQIPLGMRDAASLAARLEEQGVLIRCCANFPPLDERYFRVAVRSESENRRLLVLLDDALHGH